MRNAIDGTMRIGPDGVVLYRIGDPERPVAVSPDRAFTLAAEELRKDAPSLAKCPVCGGGMKAIGTEVCACRHGCGGWVGF